MLPSSEVIPLTNVGIRARLLELLRMGRAASTPDEHRTLRFSTGPKGCVHDGLRLTNRPTRMRQRDLSTVATLANSSSLLRVRVQRAGCGSDRWVSALRVSCRARSSSVRQQGSHQHGARTQPAPGRAPSRSPLTHMEAATRKRGAETGGGASARQWADAVPDDLEFLVFDSTHVSAGYCGRFRFLRLH